MSFDPVSYLMGAKSGGGGGGSGGGVLVVHMDSSNDTLDKTWREITSAPSAVVRFESYGNIINAPVVSWFSDEEVCSVTIIEILQDGTFTATDFVSDSADGYPVKD